MDLVEAGDEGTTGPAKVTGPFVHSVLGVIIVSTWSDLWKESCKFFISHPTELEIPV